MKVNKTLLGFIVSLGLISACGSGGVGTAPTNTTTAFITNYANIVAASYEDSVSTADALHDAIDAFIADPTDENFTAAKEAWLASREPYGQTEAYRFYNGPIDDPDTGPEHLINSWPLDESFIDYVDGDANSGLVNDTTITITEENLVDRNGLAAEDAITTGYHAIEFLLWGQDLNAQPTDAGLRSFTDFMDGGTNQNQDRRREYLELTAHILLDNLTDVSAQWAAGGSNYRSQLLAATSAEALRRIIVGMGSLAGGELGGERMANALATRGQEEEHSCFSDNTHRDLVNNLQGILNIYNGTYRRVNGTTVGTGVGLSDLVQAVNPALNVQLQTELTAAEIAIDGISDRVINDDIHFDQQIDTDEDRVRIQTAVTALQNFADRLSEAAAALGVNINLDTDGQ